MYDEPAPVGAKPLTQIIRETCNDLERLRGPIEEALLYAEGTHTFDDVCAMVLQGRVRFWPLAHSALITEVIDFPRQKHYHMWLGGGILQEILDMHEEVIAAAKEAGCCKLTVNGRAGWLKPLQRYGWHFSYSSLTLDLE